MRILLLASLVPALAAALSTSNSFHEALTLHPLPDGKLSVLFEFTTYFASASTGSSLRELLSAPIPSSLSSVDVDVLRTITSLPHPAFSVAATGAQQRLRTDRLVRCGTMGSTAFRRSRTAALRVGRWWRGSKRLAEEQWG
jgi:hypothetical protein